MKKNAAYLIASILSIALQISAGCSKKDTDKIVPEVLPLKTTSISGFYPKSAKAGSLLTITGELFSTHPNVSVIVRFADGANVKPKSVTTTEITVDVPPAAKTGQITLLINGATLITKDTFTLIL